MNAVMTAGFNPVIILRYHDHPSVVHQRLRWLRALNPGVPIYGLCGSKLVLPAETRGMLADNHYLEMLPDLAWRNVDLALVDWFRAIGRNIPFSHAYVVEWDLVYLKGIQEVLPVPAEGESLLTGWTPLSVVEWKWDLTNGKKPVALGEWLELKRFVSEMYGYNGPYYASLGPGMVLSRAFFEKYSDMELPLLCQDVLRVPLVHLLLGLPVRSTGLYPPNWYRPEHEAWVRRFNVRHWEVEPRAVARDAKHGHVAFHPVTKLLNEHLIKLPRNQ